MFFNKKLICNFAFIIFISALTISCVTETVATSPAMRFSDTAIVSVQGSDASVVIGSTFAWLPEAIRFYDDKRLKNAPVKSLIKKAIVKNLKAKEMTFVDSANGARYVIAYTAALESSLDDIAIIRRFGLLPGNSQVPKNDTNIEKGSLIIYVFNNKTNEIVWRSAAQVGVQFDMPAKERKERVERVIAEMFQTLPVSE
ncbi:MAG: DUF4136 domain-containing protein [Gammaproteobacteria bacterium]|nr:DUF4136 domain-containing protein [Gammaproteobacteria bacterium]